MEGWVDLGFVYADNARDRTSSFAGSYPHCQVSQLFRGRAQYLLHPRVLQPQGNSTPVRSKLHLLRFFLWICCTASWNLRNKSTVYSKPTTSCMAEFHITLKAYSKCTASQHVKMLYDLLSNKSTTNRPSGVWTYSLCWLAVPAISGLVLGLMYPPP